MEQQSEVCIGSIPNVPLALQPSEHHPHSRQPKAQCGRYGMSVILINVMRPENVRFIQETLSLHPAVLDIITVHSLHSTAIKRSDRVPKVTDVFAYKDPQLRSLQQNYRGAQRFFYAEYAQCDRLLFLDDDVLPTPETLPHLASKVNENPRTLFGVLKLCMIRLFPRLCLPGGEVSTISPWKAWRGSSDMIHGLDANTILTGLSAMHRDVVRGFVGNFCTLYEPVLRRTHGNGEDLAMNDHVRRSQQMPVLIRSGGYKHIISRNKRLTHGQHASPVFSMQRNEVCQTLCTGSPFICRRGDIRE